MRSRIDLDSILGSFWHQLPVKDRYGLRTALFEGPWLGWVRFWIHCGRFVAPLSLRFFLLLAPFSLEIAPAAFRPSVVPGFSPPPPGPILENLGIILRFFGCAYLIFLFVGHLVLDILGSCAEFGDFGYHLALLRV